MYFFDRKTMYFVWYREDGQAKSVGSAQLTAVENVCRIEVSVTNCGRVEGEFPCYLLSGPVESLLGMIRLQKGKGTLSVRCDADKVGHAQVPYGKLTGIHIDLKTDGYLEQKWLPTGPCMEARTKRESVSVEEPERVIGDIMPYRRKTNDMEWNIERQKEANSERKAEEKTYRERTPEEMSSERKTREEAHGEWILEKMSADRKQGENIHGEQIPEDISPARKMGEEIQGERIPGEMSSERKQGREIHGDKNLIENRTEENDSGQISAVEDANKKAENRKKREKEGEELSEIEEKELSDRGKKQRTSHQEPGPLQLYPDKWRQLCAIYPIVHPFGDARGYLSIEPRDFVILQERYQTMVQNSFLLHGFYNYRHLLLGRRRGERETQYYLGVPGVLYEKERAAALFYGFEAFESASVPAKDGDFGYYMKRVKI